MVTGKYKSRVQFFFLLVVLSLLTITAKLFYLQFMRGDYYRARSEKMNLHEEDIEALRGRIFDRNNEIIADTAPAYSIAITLADLGKIDRKADKAGTFVFDQELKERLFTNLSELLQKPREEIEQKIAVDLVKKTSRIYAGQTRYDAVPVLEITTEGWEDVRKYPDKYPGASVVFEPKRRYLLNEVGAAMIGRCGPIPGTQTKLYAQKGYRDTDTVGLEGLEKQYEEILRGHIGRKRIQRVPNGPDLVTVKKKEVPGQDLHLTIDIELQKAIGELLGQHLKNLREEVRGFGLPTYKWPMGGAVVAIDPRNGEVLALVSYPSFNPNTFTDDYNQLLTDEFQPLYDRSTRGEYPLGSLFKPFTALTALQTFPPSRFNKNTPVVCNHLYTFGDRTFQCLGSHGSITMESALQHSCNIYFYEVGKRLTGKPLCKWARNFGFGSKTGLDLPSESDGNVPLSDKSTPTQISRYPLGSAVQLAIGQAELTVTPLQVANGLCAIANGGKIYRPHLRKDISAEEQKPLRELNLSDDALRTVREGMRRVVNEAGGTGFNSFKNSPLVRKMVIAGKTGSATQEIQVDNARVEITHAWFGCFAPYENPEIVLVVMIERGGKGGHSSAPVACKIMEKFFDGRQ